MKRMNETRISSLRQELGWAQERLATESGVGLRTIQRLEAGHDASLETLSLVSGALRVSVRDLFTTLDGDDVNGRVEAVALRAQLQQGSRDRTIHAWLWPFVGIGVLMTLIGIPLGQLGAGLILTYWAGLGFALCALRFRVLEPRLDKRYPLSHRTELLKTRTPALRTDGVGGASEAKH